MINRLIQIVFFSAVFAFLFFIAGCKKEQIPTIEKEYPVVKCDSICYDTLSFAKRIAYYPWTLIESKYLGTEYNYPIIKFYPDIPFGSFYNTGFSTSFQYPLPIPNPTILGYFSAKNRPYFKMDSVPSVEEGYDLLPKSPSYIVVNNDFEFLVVDSGYTIQNAPFRFSQIQITVSAAMEEAYVYYYGHYSPPAKGSDPPWHNGRLGVGFYFTRDSVPPCQCIDELVNYP